MFPRATIRRKDGKVHRYWSVVQTRRVVQRPALYPGEINNSEAQAWRKSIGVLDDSELIRGFALDGPIGGQATVQRHYTDRTVGPITRYRQRP